MSSALAGASQAGASDPALNATVRSEARSLSAFFVMRKLQPLQQRVEAARKAEFAAAATTRAAQRALIEEEEGCGLKRRKVEVEEHDDNWKEWAHSDWVRMETWARNRRAVELRNNVNVLPPRDGNEGFLHHPRRGLDASALSFIEWDETMEKLWMASC